MSYKIKLTIDGEERYVRTYHADYFLPNPIDKMLIPPASVRVSTGTKNGGFDAWKHSLINSYDRTLPWYSKPNGKSVLGGLFPLTLESTSNDDVFYFWLKDQSMLNGSLEFFRTKEGEEDIPFNRIDFWDAYLVEMEETASKGSDAMWMQLLISPGIIRYNKETIHKKPWHITDIEKKEPTPTESSEQYAYLHKDVEVTSIRWLAELKDRDGKLYYTEITDLLYDKEAIIEVKVKNETSGMVYLTVKNEDNYWNPIPTIGCKINPDKSLTLSGIINSEGIARIRFTAKRSWALSPIIGGSKVTAKIHELCAKVEVKDRMWGKIHIVDLQKGAKKVNLTKVKTHIDDMLKELRLSDIKIDFVDKNAFDVSSFHKLDSYAVIGDAEEVKEFVKTKDLPSYRRDGGAYGIYDFTGWQNMEKADCAYYWQKRRCIVLCQNGIIKYAPDFKLNSELFSAFLIIHAAGHNAGMFHVLEGSERSTRQEIDDNNCAFMIPGDFMLRKIGKDGEFGKLDRYISFKYNQGFVKIMKEKFFNDNYDLSKTND